MVHGEVSSAKLAFLVAISLQNTEKHRIRRGATFDFRRDSPKIFRPRTMPLQPRRLRFQARLEPLLRQAIHRILVHFQCFRCSQRH